MTKKGIASSGCQTSSELQKVATWQLFKILCHLSASAFLTGSSSTE